MDAAADGERGLRVVLLGAPGSGKGTQAAILSTRWGVPAISTGEMLREAVAAGSELGGRVAGVMATGELVEDGLMAEVVRERLGRKDASLGFLLDGYPRTPLQACTLEGMLKEADSELDAVVLLEVPEEVLVARAVARNRPDDRAEIVRERLRVYRERTEPLVGYYDERGLLRRIDGDRPVEEVTERILEAVAGSRTWC
ncbi:MAG: adenylate kinase [Acidobacteria bacterium RBG_16_64_8]|nr:MAG: adenylate kinase [Acidobacteria bacterium RBG_16_64_8]